MSYQLAAILIEFLNASSTMEAMDGPPPDRQFEITGSTAANRYKCAIASFDVGDLATDKLFEGYHIKGVLTRTSGANGLTTRANIGGFFPEENEVPGESENFGTPVGTTPLPFDITHTFADPYTRNELISGDPTLNDIINVTAGAKRTAFGSFTDAINILIEEAWLIVEGAPPSACFWTDPVGATEDC